MADMTAVRHHYDPEVVLPPGDTLAELLQERGIAQAEFTERSGLSAEHVNRIISGEAPITTEIAELLESETGVSAVVWANLETTFQACKTRTRGKARTDRSLVAGAVDGR